MSGGIRELLGGGEGVRHRAVDEGGKVIAGRSVRRCDGSRGDRQREVRRVGERRRHAPSPAQGARQIALADEHGRWPQRQACGFGGPDAVEGTAEPTVELRPRVVGLRGLPDGHAPEVRPIGIRVAHPLHDRQPAVLDHVGRGSHRRVQADATGQLAHALGRDSQLPAMPGIVLIPERDNGVDAVVAAVELDHDQDAAVALGPGRHRGSREEARYGRCQREHGRTLQQTAVREHGKDSNPSSGQLGFRSRE